MEPAERNSCSWRSVFLEKCVLESIKSEVQQEWFVIFALGIVRKMRYNQHIFMLMEWGFHKTLSWNEKKAVERAKL